MSNSIVFQNNAEQLKASMYGFNSTSGTYKPLMINDAGELLVKTGTSVIEIGTINKIAVLGTVNYLGLLGTVNKVANIGTLGTVNKVSVLGTVNKVSLLGTLSNVVGTVKVNLVDRTFTTITQTITVGSATTTYSNLINISKYQDTSWYFLNTSSTNRRAVTVQLAVTPSTAIGTYPRTLIIESATVNESPKVITNDYYLEYIAAQIRNTSSYQQNIVAVFNGRY